MHAPRHRLVRTVAGLAVAATAALVPALAGSGAAQAATTDDFTLHPAATKAASLSSSLNKKLYRDSVSTILKKANRKARKGTACHTNAFAGESVTNWRYCFDGADSKSPEWVPQGVTGVSDAKANESWNGTKPLLVSWYDSKNAACHKGSPDWCHKKGSRISFLDSQTGRYANVLLAYPKVNSAHHLSYSPVNVHAGGITWYGNYLYVADTYRGIRVFDMRRIFDLNPDGKAKTNDKQQDADVRSSVRNKNKIGRHDNIFYGYGYRYVMTQVAAYTHPTASSSNANCGTGYGRSSYLSIDRSTKPDTIVNGEFCRDTNGRVVRYPLDASTGKLKMTVTRTSDSVVPTETHRLPVKGVQGAAVYDRVWYFNTSHGCKANSNGLLYKAITPAGVRSPLVLSGAPKKVATGNEDLYVWRGKKKLVSISEYRSTMPNCYASHVGRTVYGTGL